MITDELLIKLERLSKVILSQGSYEKYKVDISNILELVNNISNLGNSNSLSNQDSINFNECRNDVVESGLTVEEALQNSIYRTSDGYIKIPKVVSD